MTHTKRVLGLVGVAIVAFVILASIGAQATTITLTSTADFDAGTKSSASGNYQIETVTDNLQVAGGSFELSNLKSDTFTSADSDAVTRKWANDIGGGTGSCSTVTIASEVATLAAVNAGSAKDCDLVTQSTISGNWDVRIKITEVSGTFNTAIMCMITTKECTSSVDRAFSGSANGVLIRHLIGTLTVWSVASGALTQQGVNVALVAGTFWFRLTRSSTTYTAYHSGDGSSWTQDAQFTDAGPSGTRYGGFGILRNGDAYGSVRDDFDDWNVAAGTIDAGGYATSGDWLSAGQSTTSDLFRSVTVTYSGASASDYITAVSLVSGAGGYPYVDNTDLTTGSSHTYTVPNLQIAGAWKVQVNLTGGNAGTVNVAQVEIVHTPNAAPSIVSPITEDRVIARQAYTQAFSATDSDGQSVTWSMATDATGLSINATTGTVSGMVDTPGPYFVNVTATDPLGASDSDNYTLTVTPIACTLSPVIPGGMIFILALIGVAVLLAFVATFIVSEKSGSGGIRNMSAPAVTVVVIGAVVLLAVLGALLPNLTGC